MEGMEREMAQWHTAVRMKPARQEELAEEERGRDRK